MVEGGARSGVARRVEEDMAAITEAVNEED